MSEIVINEKLVITYPKGFHVMNEKERSRLQIMGSGESVCLYDHKRNMLVTVGWKEIVGKSAKIVNSRDLARNMEKSVTRAMRSYRFRRLAEY